MRSGEHIDEGSWLRSASRRAVGVVLGPPPEAKSAVTSLHVATFGLLVLGIAAVSAVSSQGVLPEGRGAWITVLVCACVWQAASRVRLHLHADERVVYDASDLVFVGCFVLLSPVQSAVLLAIGTLHAALASRDWRRALIEAGNKTSAACVLAVLGVARSLGLHTGHPGGAFTAILLGFAIIPLSELLIFAAGYLGVTSMPLGERGRMLGAFVRGSFSPQELCHMLPQPAACVLLIFSYRYSAPSILLLTVPLAMVQLDMRRSHQLAAARRQIGIDPLTGLSNRARFAEHVSEEMENAERYGHHLVLAMSDLDNFKRVNDTHGHLAGDEVLRRAASAIDRVVQEAHGAVARYGGEEFVVLLAVTGRFDPLTVIEHARRAVEEALRDYDTTISFGLTTSADTDDLTELIARADHALYAAKYAGKNQVHKWLEGGMTLLIEPVTADRAA